MGWRDFFAHSLTAQYSFFPLHYHKEEKSKDSKNNMTGEMGRGRCGSDVKVTKKGVKDKKKKKEEDA